MSPTRSATCSARRSPRSCGIEIAGANGLLPVMWAAHIGLPLVDADGRGRAFPELRQQAMHIAGIEASPVVVTDGRGNTLVLYAADDRSAERIVRGAAGSFGGVCAGALYCMSASRRDRRRCAGRSRTLGIGATMAQSAAGSFPAAAYDALGAETLSRGQGRHVERRRRRLRARVRHGARSGNGARQLRLELQNEFLFAVEDGVVRAAVPDIISVLSARTRASRYRPSSSGRQPRSSSSALPAPAVWHSAAGLAVAGPRAFGYDVDSTPRRGRDMSADLWLGIDAGAPTPTRSWWTPAIGSWPRRRCPRRTTFARPSPRRSQRSSRTTASIRRGSRERCSAQRTSIEAILARREVPRVAVVRIGAPDHRDAAARRPGPTTARRGVGRGGDGPAGRGFDGRAVAPLDADALARFLAGGGRRRPMRSRSTSVFSPVAADQELEAAEVVRRELGTAAPVSLSHEIGSLGLLERENAAVLNAALVGRRRALAGTLDQALEGAGHRRGRVLRAERRHGHGARSTRCSFPPLMIGSGPASSMRGAAYLSGVDRRRRRRRRRAIRGRRRARPRLPACLGAASPRSAGCEWTSACPTSSPCPSVAARWCGRPATAAPGAGAPSVAAGSSTRRSSSAVAPPR